MDSVPNGVNVCGGLLPGEYRYRTLCLYANGDVVLCPFVSFRSPFGAGLDRANKYTRTPGSPAGIANVRNT